MIVTSLYRNVLTYYRVHPYGELGAEYNGILSTEKEKEHSIRAGVIVNKYRSVLSAVVSTILCMLWEIRYSTEA
jgi:hypothetical protein